MTNDFVELIDRRTNCTRFEEPPMSDLLLAYRPTNEQTRAGACSPSADHPSPTGRSSARANIG
jgi:hypothetical protein